MPVHREVSGRGDNPVNCDEGDIEDLRGVWGTGVSENVGEDLVWSGIVEDIVALEH